MFARIKLIISYEINNLSFAIWNVHNLQRSVGGHASLDIKSNNSTMSQFGVH